MKNSAIDSTSEILNADQMSMLRSCSRARRGPRPALPPRPGRLPCAFLAGAAAGGAPAAATVAPAPVAGAGAPVTPVAPVAPVAAASLWARMLPVVGMAWVVETEAGDASAVSCV